MDKKNWNKDLLLHEHIGMHFEQFHLHILCYYMYLSNLSAVAHLEKEAALSVSYRDLPTHQQH